LFFVVCHSFETLFCQEFELEITEHKRSLSSKDKALAESRTAHDETKRSLQKTEEDLTAKRDALQSALKISETALAEKDLMLKQIRVFLQEEMNPSLLKTSIFDIFS
jgi:uncharacterized protein YlxW (UPF0749 family)